LLQQQQQMAAAGVAGSSLALQHASLRQSSSAATVASTKCNGAAAVMRAAEQGALKEQHLGSRLLSLRSLSARASVPSNSQVSGALHPVRLHPTVLVLMSYCLEPTMFYTLGLGCRPNASRQLWARRALQRAAPAWAE
jgi:hypothetical protein